MLTINIRKQLLFSFIFTFLFLKTTIIFSGKEVNKQYYNNILAGGSARLFSYSSNINEIEIYYIYINIFLFKDYSYIEVTYKIKNNGSDKKIYFAYPRLDAKINKIVTTSDNKTKEQVLKKGSYINYTIKINGAVASYDIKNDDLIELMFPYKAGNLIQIENDVSNLLHEEIVDSFNLIYSWHVSEIDIKSEEKKVIKISYVTPHYYNTISVKNSGKNLNLEDPAFRYLSSITDDFCYYESEKILFFPLCSSYADKNKAIDNLKIKMRTNIIDKDYLKINPINYKKRGKNYYWKYNNLHVQPINNILVKISPLYSKETISPLLFESNKSKNIDDYKSYYELSGASDEIVFKCRKNESIQIKRIKILPEYYEYKSELKNANIPLEFEVSFSDNENFSNSKTFIKKYSKKKSLRSLKRKSYIEIYDGKAIKGKYIKIRVLQSSRNNENIKINDIQFIR